MSKSEAKETVQKLLKGFTSSLDEQLAQAVSSLPLDRSDAPAFLKSLASAFSVSLPKFSFQLFNEVDKVVGEKTLLCRYTIHDPNLQSRGPGKTYLRTSEAFNTLTGDTVDLSFQEPLEQIATIKGHEGLTTGVNIKLCLSVYLVETSAGTFRKATEVIMYE